ncbi:MAG: RDD family protein [Bacteroidia bacterium]
MNTIVIPTTQNIELEYPVANMGERIAAGLIDLGVLSLYLFIWVQIINRYYYERFWDDLMNNEDPTSSVRTLFVLIMLPLVCYSLLCEIFFNGRTVGKLLLKLQTIRTDGSSPTLSHYLLRWVARIVDVWLSMPLMAPGLVGIIVMGVSKKGQRLGDLLAGTTVIKLKLVTSFMDTIYAETGEGYVMVFPEIQHLRDRDVSILKEVLDAGIRADNPVLLAKLAAKVKEVAGISSRMEPRPFLETVLRDYNHYYGGNDWEPMAGHLHRPPTYNHYYGGND